MVVAGKIDCNNMKRYIVHCENFEIVGRYRGSPSVRWGLASPVISRRPSVTPELPVLSFDLYIQGSLYAASTESEHGNRKQSNKRKILLTVFLTAMSAMVIGCAYRIYICQVWSLGRSIVRAGKRWKTGPKESANRRSFVFSRRCCWSHGRLFPL